jgi:hypothetical protein
MAIRCKQIQFLKAGETVIKDIDKAIVLRESIIITDEQFEKFNSRSDEFQYVKIEEVKAKKKSKKDIEPTQPTEQLEPTE